MWRDELQAWLIVRASDSFPSLLANLRYESHPLLWYLLLWPFASVLADPAAMQLVTSSLAATTAWILLFRSPFPRYQRGLLALGYFFFFEYAVVSRSYVLGSLLTVLALDQLTRGRRGFPHFVASLCLLGHTSVFGMILSSGLALASLILRSTNGRPLMVGAAAYVASTALAVLSIREAADGVFAAGWNLTWNTARALKIASTVWRAYVPIPPLTGDYGWWNISFTDFLDSPIKNGVVTGFTGILGLIFYSLRARLAALTAVAVPTLGLLVFFYIKVAGASRYNGHLFLALVSGAWIAAASKAGSPSPFRQLWIALLPIQAAGGLLASVHDLRWPWTAGRETARFLEERGLASRPIVAYPDFIGTTLSGYLNRSILNFESGVPGTFVVWSTRRKPIHPDEALEHLQAMRAKPGEPFLAVLNFAFYAPPGGFKELKRSPHGFTEAEAMVVYEVDRKPAR